MSSEQVSSVQAEQIEKERKAKLAKDLRARMSRSKLEVTAPKGWTAYWARKDDDAELGRLDYLGFRIVKESSDPTKQRYKAQGRRADGTYVMGDIILMEIPTEEWDMYQSMNDERAKGMPQAAKDRFREDAEKQGAPTFNINRKN